MSAVNRKWTDGMLTTEDWWAVWLGLIMFFAGLMTIWCALWPGIWKTWRGVNQRRLKTSYLENFDSYPASAGFLFLTFVECRLQYRYYKLIFDPVPILYLEINRFHDFLCLD